MSAESGPARFGPWRREAAAFLELFALTGIAVAQPTFDLIGKNANELIVNGRTRSQILIMVIVVLAVPPALAWTAEVAVGLVAPMLRRFAHAAIAAVVVGTIAVEVLKQQTGWGPVLLLVAGAVLGLGGGIVLLRIDVAGRFLRYLAFAPVAFAILLVFFSPVSTVMFPSDAEAADVEIGNPDRVVMIVMDELPLESLLDGTGQIDAELFPNFARLAATSNWYRNHTTVSPATETAVPALLSGELPEDEALAVASDHPNTLFTLLGDRYAMNVHETLTQLCPATICPTAATRRGSHPGLRGFLFDTAELWRGFASPSRSGRAAGSFDLGDEGVAQRAGGPFIRSLRSGTGAELDFLHVMLPHQGWHLLGTGQDNVATFESQQALTANGTAIWPDGWRASIGRQRHLLQLQYADRWLGQMMNKLERIGAWDESLVVVTADHGIAFAASEPVRGVSEQNFDQILWTPLFIKARGQTRGVASDQPVLSVDVLPSIADQLDVELPWKSDGRSVFGKPRAEGPVPILRWVQSTLAPNDGSDFNELDGVSGFARARSGRAAQADGDPTLRLYRLGPHGALVGTPAASLARAAEGGPAATINDRAKFEAVNPTAAFAPWTWISGALDGVAPGASVAVTVNGVIAGISEAYPDSQDRPVYWSSLPPQLFRAGPNEIGMYRIDGSPASPRLVPVRITG